MQPAEERRASRPAILTVDDDGAVSRAVARDLRRRYGEEFRIVRAESGQQALEALREIKLRGDRVAVLLADYRMPEMSGLEFLEHAMDLFPSAARALPDRLRRHRCGDPGHQRHRPRSLSAQAVGPAGGEALPGDRRPDRGVASGPGARRSTRRSSSGTAGPRAATRSATSSRATWCRTATSPPTSPRVPDSARGGRARRRRGTRWSSRLTGR